MSRRKLVGRGWRAGDMIYAGKYSKPDYELLVSEGCDLAIENRMITHSPEVVEMLQSFDIPVMIEYSSYEQHPLGKVEWVKFFGALTGKEAKAEEAFAEQTEILEEVESGEKTGRTIAFFYVTSNGLIQVRQSTDYVEAKKRRFGEESKAITGKSEMKPAEKSTEEETQEKKTGKNWKDGQRQKVKFSFKEQREYETIDEEIAKLEEKIASLDRQIAANATNSVKLRELMEEQEKVRGQLEEKEERWMYLNELAEEFGL